MGKVVEIRRRPHQVRRSAAELLERATQLYREELNAADSLPGALAALARAGQVDKALSLLVAWGERVSTPRLVLQQVRLALQAEPGRP